MKMSLSNGVEVFVLIILVFSNLKSTTGLFLSLPFHATNIMGDVCVVLFLVRMPNETKFCMHLSIRGLSSSAIGKGLTKKVEGSLTSMLTFMSGHFPISSLRLKAFLLLIMRSMTSSFSLSVRCDSERSMYLYNISSSVMCLLGSSLSNHGYGSGPLSLVPLFL